MGGLRAEPMGARKQATEMISKYFYVTALTVALSSAAFCQKVNGEPRTAVSVSPVGIQRFSPGGWSSLSVNGTNDSDADTVEIVSVYLGDDPSIQFSKRFWLPAHAQRRTWLPILVPPGTPLTDQQVSVSTMRLTESDGAEAFAENHLGMPITERSLMLTPAEINTAIMTDRGLIDETRESRGAVQRIYRLVYAGRDAVLSSSLQLGLSGFDAHFLPPTPGALDELDQLVIASDRILSDSGGVMQVREWLRSGGRIWVMLDHTSEETLTTLIGENASVTVVDRVELNEFEIESRAIDRRIWKTESWSSEVPVEMVRVFTDADEVVTRVDGWPAAFWVPVGRGEVLVTTMNARGWIQEDRPGDALIALSRRFFEANDAAGQPVRSLIPILDSQIGYQIPSRRVAGTVLGLNVLVVLVAGAWWARQRRLERMAWLIPVTSISATAILLFVGHAQQSSVPSTVATGQFVRLDGAADEAHISTVHAIYRQDAGESGIVSKYRVLATPGENDSRGQITRILWDDDGTSTWQEPDQPPGVVRYIDSVSTSQLSRPIMASGTFDANGFRGTLEGLDLGSCEDGVIVAAPAPCTSVELTSAENHSGSFAGGVNRTLAPGQYISETLLSADQRMRQDFLRRLYASRQEEARVHVPTLLLWTDPFDLDVQFDKQFSRRGTALVSIPIRLRRPEPEIKFQIPATFIRIDAFAGNRGVSSLFNPRTGKWFQQRTKAAEVELSCKFPKPLLPLDLQSVTLSVKINAPARSLVVKGMINGQPTVLYEEREPIGLTQFTIDRREALQLDAEGGLWLEISVSETEAEMKAKQNADDGEQDATDLPAQEPTISTWQIEYVHVDAVGVAAPSTKLFDAEKLKAGQP